MPSVNDAHHELIDQMIARSALRSAALIAAFRATPRHWFLDRVWQQQSGRWRDLPVVGELTEDDVRLAYSDRAITTHLSEAGDGSPARAISSSSQPSLMAQMLEDLRLHPGLRVLEIGAGTGYNAALLAHVVGRVTSIDVDRAVLTRTRRRLDLFVPERNIELHHADGRDGWPAGAPYDRIMVTAATLGVESAWLGQLAEGGLLQMPLDLGPGLAWILQGEVRDGIFAGGLLRAAYFMPLRDEGDPGPDRDQPATHLPRPDKMKSLKAPWADWRERRWGAEDFDFLQALALLALLQGMVVTQGNTSGFGIADPHTFQTCWFSAYDWRVSEPGGEALAQQLWRRWLDLGGPRPEDWEVRAAADAGRLRASPGAKVTHRRDLGRCPEIWELIERG